jgi:hypothetical protein
MSSQTLFLADLRGLHMLSLVFMQQVKEVLEAPKSPERMKVLYGSLRILGQFVCLPANFIPAEKTVQKEEGRSFALTHINRYLELRKAMSPFTDLVIKSNRFVGEEQGLCLWLSALFTLQNRPIEVQYAYLQDIIQYCFVNKFDKDIFEPKLFPTLLVILDIIELFVWAFAKRLDTATSTHLNTVMTKLMAIADDKLPLEGRTHYKKLAAGKNCGYEKVLCAIIELCLLIVNVNTNYDCVSVLPTLNRSRW